MDRKLASIQKILKLEPIENADAIEKATVLGWSVVVKKGEFKVGDLVVYCEVDCLMPDKPEYQFLAPKFRIRTVRLRGQISQGICFPLSVLPLAPNQSIHSYPEGVDVTSILGVKKYEPPIPESMAGKMRGTFPSFIPKTDEIRLQIVPSILEKHKDMPFYVTEKVDGSSTTFFIDNDEFHVCSRNTDLFDTPDNLLWRVAKEMEIEKKLRSQPEGLVLQGEIVGGKVQGNPLKLDKPTILFFSAYNYKLGKYYGYEDFVTIFDRLYLPTVPVVAEGFKLLKTVDEMVEFATKKSKLNDRTWAEGLVFRSEIEMTDEDLEGRLSFKVINPEYLLENKDA